MKIKTVIIALILVLTVSTIGSILVFAETDQQKLNNITEKTRDLQDDMNGIEEDIKAKAQEVDQINNKMADKEAELNQIAADIQKAKVEMQEREDGLNERLRAMYKNGSIGYIEVILGSHSISEFISNVEMIKRIYKNDQDVMKILKEEKAKLEKKEDKLQAEKQELVALQEEAKEKQRVLQTQKDKLEAQIDKLNAQADQVKADIASKQDTNKKYTGGRFVWPSPGYYEITSEFGFRLHPILNVWKGHTGIDIGVPSNKRVVAAASGTVIVASSYGGYGNAVVIDHGSGISTLYGHNNQLLVSVGQKVSQGQTIAKSGSTGWSTGPHLHFEVRVGGEYVDPMNYF